MDIDKLMEDSYDAYDQAGNDGGTPVQVELGEELKHLAPGLHYVELTSVEYDAEQGAILLKLGAQNG